MPAVEIHLWYEFVHTIYGIARFNTQIPILLGCPGIKPQPSPLRHSFIPSYVPFDLTVVVFQILNLPKVILRQYYRNPGDFWNRHFKTNLRPFCGTEGKEFDRMFWTDGYGVSILKWTAGTKTGVGQKRKTGQKKER